MHFVCSNCRKKQGLKDSFGSGPVNNLEEIQCNSCAKTCLIEKIPPILNGIEFYGSYVIIKED